MTVEQHEDDETWRDDVESVPPLRLVEHPTDRSAWYSDLIIVTKEIGEGPGKPKRKVRIIPPELANVITVLRRHPSWLGVLAYSQFAETAVYRAPPPWHDVDSPSEKAGDVLSDSDITRIVAWFQRTWLEVPGVQGARWTVADKIVESAVAIAAEANAFHPVRQYLAGLTWDGTARLDRVLPDYFQTRDGEYERAIGPRWFISAVARVMKPGCQVDCTLILESAKQGEGKSSALRAIVPDATWYADNTLDLSNKDALQALHGVWIYGLDELDSMRKAEVSKVKGFLTQTKDHFRKPFAKRATDHFRQNVFCGTTNETTYFSDPTGNRRFWPVKILRPTDPAIIARDRDQLWAEAHHRYLAGERWHVDTPELRALCEVEQEDRRQQDAWLPIIETWLARPTETTSEPDQFGRPQRHTMPADEPEHGWTLAEVMVHAIGKRPSEIGRPDEMRVAAILTELGYSRRRVREGAGSRACRYRRNDA
jgi:putative DNA primase/helicase